MDIVSALRTFLRVAESGSFSAAAIDLGLTQPAVSRQVAALETHLNLRLLHRTTNSLALTVEGERTIAMALKVVEAVDALGEGNEAHGIAVSGKVRLSLPAPLSLYLADRLPRMLQDHPKLSVELIANEDATDMVSDGIDLEVRVGHIDDSGLICRRIGWTTAFLVAAPSYLERRDEPKRPEAINDHDCLCYARAGDARTWSFSNGADELRVRTSPRFIAHNAMAVHRTALAGGGIALLSHILVGPDIGSGRLKRLMPDFPPTRLPISVVYLSRRSMPLRVRTVLDFLVQAVQEDPDMTTRTRDAETAGSRA